MNKKNESFWKRIGIGQLAIPLTALALLFLFNLIRDPGFFSVVVNINNDGNPVLGGNLISVINSASELAIISMGMTLVTAATGGQDISVGAVGAISASVFIKTLIGMGDVTGGTLIVAVLACIATAIAFMMINGTLVSVFRIQPMIATLILYSCGRSIAYWITGSATPQVDSPIITAIGMTIPGIPVPTPVFMVILVGLVLALIFRMTNTTLYTQSVGINQGAARLNGINPTAVKMLAFGLLGLCVAVASIIATCRMSQVSHKTLLVDIEMDAILAVAIGGNSLGGGKFRMSGSILGAYIITMLTVTLLAMGINSVNIKAYKAVVIIVIVAAGSPVIKSRIAALKNRRSADGSGSAALKGGAVS